MGQDINSINQDPDSSSPSLIRRTSSSGPLGRKVRSPYQLRFSLQTAGGDKTLQSLEPLQLSACVTGLVFTLSDPDLGLIFTSTQWVPLLFKTVDVTKLWFSDGLQPNQLWFETKTSLVEVRAYSTSSQSGRRFCLSSKQSDQSVES